MSTAFRIESRSLVFRKFTSDDVASVFKMSQEDCARQWLPSQVCRDEQHAASVVEFLIDQFDLNASPITNAFVFGVEEKKSGRLVGHVGLSPLFGGVEVGFGIAESEQRKGYATEAVARICEWGMERFSLATILGVTDRENVASQKVLARSGFRLKEDKMMRFQGVDRPVIIFEIGRRGPRPPPTPEAAAIH